MTLWILFFWIPVAFVVLNVIIGIMEVKTDLDRLADHEWEGDDDAGS